MIDIDELFDSTYIKKVKRLENEISLINDIEIWVKEFNKDLKLLNRSINTIESYNFTLNAFTEYCSLNLENNKGLCGIEANHCNDFLLWMENYETNKKYGSLKERISYLVEFLAFSKETNGDFLEQRESYMKICSHDIVKVNFALSEFEDYYYANEISLKHIDNNYIVNYIKAIPKASIATMLNRRACLHKFFTFIAEETQTDCFEELLRKMKQYKKQKGSIHGQHNKIDEETIELFLNLLDSYVENPSIIQKRVRKNSQHIAYRDVSMILLMYRGGLRVSEALNVRVKDITEVESSYRVDVIGGKGNKNRTTYFKRVYFDKYYNYFKRELPNSESFLSENSSGKKLDRRTLYLKVKKLFEKLQEEGSINKSITGLHIFRHLFGKEFSEKDGNMKILQDLLGHSVITTTMIYSDVGEKAKEEAIALM